MTANSRVLADAHFDIGIRSHDGVTTMELTGEFDLDAEQLFEEKLRVALGGMPGHLVIDLRGVSFIDSSGIRSLADALSLAGEHRIDLSVVRGGDRISRVLQLAGVENVLPLVDEPPELPPPSLH
jgi:anti-sigma B factor antagonist